MNESFRVRCVRQLEYLPAIGARRRAWLESEKCIVFLSDDDLIEMLQSVAGDSDPFDLIDTQLEDFFRSLTP